MSDITIFPRAFGTFFSLKITDFSSLFFASCNS